MEQDRAASLRRDRGRLAGLLVAGLATIASGLWLALHMSPGMALGPWQGILIDPSPVRPVPLLSWWLTQGILGLPVANPLFWLNSASVLTGALACGALALLAVNAAQRLDAGPFAYGFGLGSALLLAVTPDFTDAASAASPAPLTLLLALMVFLYVAASWESPRPTDKVMMAGLLAGLAAANHPSMGLLAILAVIGHAMGNDRRIDWGLLLPGVLLAFLAGASLPLFNALRHGEDVAAFLSHALYAPHPALSGARPNTEFGRNLAQAIPLPVFVMAFLGVTQMVHKDGRTMAGLCAVLFLVMGPLLPVFTNPSGLYTGSSDPVATWLLVLVPVCLAAVWGGYLVARLLCAPQRMRFLVTPFATLAATGLVVWTATGAPSQASRIPQQLAIEVLDDCPQNAVLVVGNDDLWGLLTTAQRMHGARPDLTVVALPVMVHPELRMAQGREAAYTFLLTRFPPPDAWQRWAVERPYVMKELIEHGDSSVIDELACWDLVQDLFTRRPVCFVGVQAPWLAARAQLSGWVLVYPRNGDPSRDPLPRLEERFPPAACAGLQRLPATLASLALPRIEVLRMQQQAGPAYELAVALANVCPANRTLTEAMAVAAARKGDARTAQRHSSNFAALRPAAEDFAGLVQKIKAELEADRLAQEFLTMAYDLAGRRLDAPGDAERFDELVKKLWAAEQIALLADGYRIVLGGDPANEYALYQLPAVLCELGDLPAAEGLLRRWHDDLAISMNEIERMIQADGRFTLYRLLRMSAKSLALLSPNTARPASHRKTLQAACARV